MRVQAGNVNLFFEVEGPKLCPAGERMSEVPRCFYCMAVRGSIIPRSRRLFEIGRTTLTRASVRVGQSYFAWKTPIWSDDAAQ